MLSVFSAGKYFFEILLYVEKNMKKLSLVGISMNSLALSGEFKFKVALSPCAAKRNERAKELRIMFSLVVDRMIVFLNPPLAPLAHLCWLIF
tara:strand:+ start:423 stop:698 length:276 start_codon:yes stop_codon:yes gene_type:complete